jgi:hypothetical protein
MVPPVSLPRLCQDGATRRIGRVGSGDLWGHAPICEANATNLVPPASSSPADSAGKPETVPPRFSCSKMVPPVSLPRLCQDGATRRIGRVGSGDLWGHAPNCEAKAECESPNMVPPVSLPVSLPASVCRTFGATPPIRGAVVASSLRACPPRVAPVRPLLSPPGLHPPPLIVLAGDPELKSSRLKKLFTTSR